MTQGTTSPALPAAEPLPEDDRESTADISRRRALWLTLLSALVPGVAHWHAGRRRTAAVLASIGALIWASAALAVNNVGSEHLLYAVVRPTVLLMVVATAVVAVPAWIALVVASYHAVRPTGLSNRRTRTARIAVIGLCAAVAIPPTLVAHYAYSQYDLVTSVFGNGSSDHSYTAAASDQNSQQSATPIPGTGRLNVLLLGSDAGAGRAGTRVDTMVLASVDQQTGRTALLSLPRNLRNAPMPAGPARARYPGGFDDMLNGVYRAADQHPELVPGSEQPGPDLIKGTVSQILGMPVHQYAKVDLRGFQSLVNALGGVDVNVRQRMPVGETGRYFNPGPQHFDGSQALWYARSRTGGRDYDRMERQRCMISTLAEQADPVTVLNHYHKVAAAAKDNLRTDIPADMLQDLVTLADKIEPAGSTQFVPPLIDPANPDFDRMRAMAHDTIQRSESGQSPVSTDRRNNAVAAAC